MCHLGHQRPLAAPVRRGTFGDGPALPAREELPASPPAETGAAMENRAHHIHRGLTRPCTRGRIDCQPHSGELPVVGKINVLRERKLPALGEGMPRNWNVEAKRIASRGRCIHPYAPNGTTKEDQSFGGERDPAVCFVRRSWKRQSIRRRALYQCRVRSSESNHCVSELTSICANVTVSGSDTID